MQYLMNTGERLFVGVAGCILMDDHTFHGTFAAEDGSTKPVKTTVRRGASWYLTPAEVARNGKPIREVR